jgi:mannose-6-phosphate isomerase-like protein (cupin superfamily)
VPLIEPADMRLGKPLRGWVGHFFHSAHMTFGVWEVAAGAAELHEHQHPQEEVWNVVEGKIAISIDGEEHIVRRGSAIVVPPNTPHSARPLGRCRAVVVDWPLRSELPGLQR